MADHDNESLDPEGICGTVQCPYCDVESPMFMGLNQILTGTLAHMVAAHWDLMLTARHDVTAGSN